MKNIPQIAGNKRYEKLAQLYEQRTYSGEIQQELIYVPKALLQAPFPPKVIGGDSLTRTIVDFNETMKVKYTTIGNQLPYGKDFIYFVNLVSQTLRGKRQQNRLERGLLFDTVVSFTTDYEPAPSYGLGGLNYEILLGRLERLRNLRVLIQRSKVEEHPEDKNIDIETVINDPSLSVMEKSRLPKLRNSNKGDQVTPEIRPAKKGPRLTQNGVPGKEDSYYIIFDESLWKEMDDAIPLWAPLMRLYQDKLMRWVFVAQLCWRSYRCDVAQTRYGQAGVQSISFNDLKQWLGSEDTNETRLRELLEQVLKELQIVWPEVRAEFKTYHKKKPDLVISRPKDGIHLVRPRQPGLPFSLPPMFSTSNR